MAALKRSLALSIALWPSLLRPLVTTAPNPPWNSTVLIATGSAHLPGVPTYLGTLATTDELQLALAEPESYESAQCSAVTCRAVPTRIIQ